MFTLHRSFPASYKSERSRRAAVPRPPLYRPTFLPLFLYLSCKSGVWRCKKKARLHVFKLAEAKAALTSCVRGNGEDDDADVGEDEAERRMLERSEERRRSLREMFDVRRFGGRREGGGWGGGWECVRFVCTRLRDFVELVWDKIVQIGVVLLYFYFFGRLRVDGDVEAKFSGVGIYIFMV